MALVVPAVGTGSGLQPACQTSGGFGPLIGGAAAKRPVGCRPGRSAWREGDGQTDQCRIGGCAAGMVVPRAMARQAEGLLPAPTGDGTGPPCAATPEAGAATARGRNGKAGLAKRPGFEGVSWPTDAPGRRRPGADATARADSLAMHPPAPLALWGAGV